MATDRQSIVHSQLSRVRGNNLQMHAALSSGGVRLTLHKLTKEHYDTKRQQAARQLCGAKQWA